MRPDNTVVADDRYSPARAAFRKGVHLLSYHFILARNRSASTQVAGFSLDVPPTVFHPKFFLTSAYFARFLQSLDLSGRSVVEVGCGSGILSLSAARAGATSVVALDINPAAVQAARMNAKKNHLQQVMSLHSDLFSALPPTRKFDVIICSPPSFSGEPRDDADRAWHAGPGYRDILPLFDQAAQRLSDNGNMYLLISSDTNRRLIDHLIDLADLEAKEVARRSVWLEAFHILEVRQKSALSAPQLVMSEP